MEKQLMKLNVALLGAAIALGAIGCEEEELYVPPPVAAASSSAKSKDAKKKEAEAARQIEFTESEFVESEDTRDPFRDYSFLFERKLDTTAENQRNVQASQYALDELKLVAVITRSARRVMLTDPSGFGWVLHIGDYVGKAELVSTGGTDSTEVAINWRVDRIRPDSVVFIREDASHPEIPPTTREMPLYPTGDNG